MTSRLKSLSESPQRLDRSPPRTILSLQKAQSDQEIVNSLREKNETALAKASSEKILKRVKVRRRRDSLPPIVKKGSGSDIIRTKKLAEAQNFGLERNLNSFSSKLNPWKYKKKPTDQTKIQEQSNAVWDNQTNLDILQKKKSYDRETQYIIENLIKTINSDLETLGEHFAKMLNEIEIDALERYSNGDLSLFKNPGEISGKLIETIVSKYSDILFNQILLEKQDILLIPRLLEGTSIWASIYRKALERLKQEILSYIIDKANYPEILYHTLARLFPKLKDGQEELIQILANHYLGRSIKNNALVLPPDSKTSDTLYQEILKQMVKMCLEKGFLTEIMKGTSGVYLTGQRHHNKQIPLFVIKPFSEELGKKYSPSGELTGESEKWVSKAFGELGPINQVLSSLYLGKPRAFISDLEDERFKSKKDRCLVMEFVPSKCTLARLFYPNIHRDEMGNKLEKSDLTESQKTRKLEEYDEETKRIHDEFKKKCGLDFTNLCEDGVNQLNEFIESFLNAEDVRELADCDIFFYNTDSNLGNTLVTVKDDLIVSPVPIDSFRNSPQRFFGTPNTPWWLETTFGKEHISDKRASDIQKMKIDYEISKKKALANEHHITYTTRGEELDRAHLTFLKIAVEKELTRAQIWGWIGTNYGAVNAREFSEVHQEEIQMLGASRLNLILVQAKRTPGDKWENFKKLIDERTPKTQTKLILE